MPFRPTTHPTTRPTTHPISRPIILTVTTIMLAGVVYLFWPVYGFIAETNAALRNPWAWQAVPAADNCQSSPVDDDWASTSDKACELLLEHQARIHAPSLSAAVAIDGKLVWSAATGWSDLAAMTPATPDTLYRIGSTSKPVTGTLLARLIDAGLVTLDEPIGGYDDTLPNPDWHSLTLRQLASHTAGLPEYATKRDWRGVYHSMALREPHDNVRQSLSLFDGSPQRYAPGTDFEYSSFGALLIASTLQAAAGQPFEALIQQSVLAPLALESPRADQAVADRARFYQLDGNRAQPWRAVDLSNKLPGGGFMSRPKDLVRLGSAWLDPSFISPQTREQFWTQQTLNNGEINEQGYALAWRWNEAGKFAHHGGVSKGAMTWLAVYPEQSLVIALSINTTLAEFAEFSQVQSALVGLFTQEQRIQLSETGFSSSSN
ncbi:serine hydrolase domain-containing protein [Pseudohongiella sp.]|uniref:Beta-lactamase-related domain-containing protein n=1 Tax=marine sediment metagenome TaxID=412755 RepID=A0A0F9YID5_9ZZZZ|nr:serine hydrolase domain-containing protein [Pseudohongiella sp.]HDZ07836.1 class A beta-lactamase-related serine hydrolase [Pseudohongiella sp.]HEA62847.1 class A beta-lactamase-related serine hydrolase [Pseudohongiella sp.]